MNADSEDCQELVRHCLHQHECGRKTKATVQSPNGMWTIKVCNIHKNRYVRKGWTIKKEKLNA